MAQKFGRARKFIDMMSPIQRVELLRAACCVAAADGEVSEHEFALLRQLASEVGVGKASFQAMVDRALRDPEFSRSQFVFFNENRGDCIAALMQIAVSNGRISEDEENVLRILAANLQVPQDVFDKILLQCKQIANSSLHSTADLKSMP